METAQNDLKKTIAVEKINKYSITSACIGCRACVGISSNHFTMNSAGKAVVSKQPSTVEEENDCANAELFCPVSAIVKKQELPVATNSKTHKSFKIGTIIKKLIPNNVN